MIRYRYVIKKAKGELISLLFFIKKCYNYIIMLFLLSPKGGEIMTYNIAKILVYFCLYLIIAKNLF